MFSEQTYFDLAYYLLRPDFGQKKLRKLLHDYLAGKIVLNKSSEDFRKKLEKDRIKIFPFWSEDYPYLLKQTTDYPPFLFLKGDISLLSKNMVTVVGSRKMDSYGDRVLSECFDYNGDLKNICFVSGLANGVDSKVHNLCLKKGIATVGVMAGGMEKNYYRGNSVMYKYLQQYRLVISEFPPGREYFKGMFPLRNRILAGLSKKTFVIQAGDKSGALNTATHANNYGRDVFALPHSIYSDVGGGCLKLLNDGAGLIGGVGDLVDKIVN